PEPKKMKPPRTHWDMLLERRSVEEIEELLKERLDLIKARRRDNSSGESGASAAGNLAGNADSAGPVDAPADTPLRDLQQGFADVGAAHLGLAVLAFGEGDGHLDDDEPVVDRAPRQVDLEAVALRIDGGQV